MNRRSLLKTGLTLAGGTLLASNASADTLTQPIQGSKPTATSDHGRRKLGNNLEVSSIGMEYRPGNRSAASGLK